MTKDNEDALRCAERLESWYGKQAVGAVHLRRLVAENERLSAVNAELLGALKMLHDETLDYNRLNNLGGENNQCMQWARAAIQKAEEA